MKYDLWCSTVSLSHLLIFNSTQQPSVVVRVRLYERAGVTKDSGLVLAN